MMDRAAETKSRITRLFLTVPGDEVYAEVLGVFLDQIGGTGGFLGYLDASGSLVNFCLGGAARHDSRAREKTVVVPPERWADLWRRSLAEGATVVVNSTPRLPRSHVPIDRALVTPILCGEKAVGIVTLGGKDSDYTDADGSLARDLADHIAPILEARVARQREWELRTEAERVLRESEIRYRTVCENLPIAFLSLDGDGRIVHVNEVLGQILGARAQSLLGRDLRDFVQVPSGGAFHDAFVRLRDEDVLLTLACDLVRVDGTTLPALLSGRRCLDAGGRFSQAILTVVDLTARLSAEAERKRLERQLQQAQKMEALGKLASGISHDINNVLSSVTTLASALELELAEDDPKKVDLASILDACERGRSLTHSLLDFARPGRFRLEPTDLRAVVTDLVVILRRTAPRTVEVREVLADDLDTVAADPNRIKSAIMNVALNAFDAMEGRGTLAVEARNVQLTSDELVGHPMLKPGPYVELTVSDTGAGMDEATLSRVFEPFFTTKPSGRGTGLGLPMVYGTAKSHGGMVRIESAPGRGTRVHVILPALPRGVRPARKAPRMHAQARLTGTALAVDDEALALAGLVRVLQAFGLEVLSAPDGLAALDLFRERADEIVLVVADLVMPGLDGASLCRELRAKRPDLHLVAASGVRPDARIMDPLAELGVVFVLKPLTYTGLAKTLSVWWPELDPEPAPKARPDPVEKASPQEGSAPGGGPAATPAAVAPAAPGVRPISVRQMLHDRVGQRLVGMRMLLHSLAARIARESKELGEAATALQEGLGQTIDDIQEISRFLKDRSVESEAALYRLHAAVNGFSRSSGVEVRYEQRPADLRPDPRVLIALEPVLVELLSSISRHGRARRVDILLRTTAEGLEVRVTDDGQVSGDRVPDASGGAGRVQDLLREAGGVLRISSTPGGLTVHTAVVPHVRPG